mmetsp:Transcript_12083/g.18277  ORF Transcript_12083/g.18277 Transcript_12083/m.18277 type:complete len:141 (-) Transcript_12083:3741-4163(-)
MKASLYLITTTFSTGAAFAPVPSKIRCAETTALSEQKKGFIANFFDELDAFVDDATNRRLGNGAAFYGKRKSTFYGEQDFMKKDDKEIADPTEDYQGPKNAGYFQWMPDENGQMRPVTRLKNKNIERNPNFWDKEFDDDN